MYTLYGKKGSGSATSEVALQIVGAPYRVVETASWEPNDAFAELLKQNPLGQIPTLVLPDGSVISESGGDSDPSRRSRIRTAASCRASLRRAPRRCAASCSLPPTAIRRSASSTFPSAGVPMPTTTTRSRSAFAPGPGRDCTSTGRCSPTSFPPRPYLCGESLGALDIHAAVVSRWAGTRKHSRSTAPRFMLRCCASRRIRKSPRFSRSTGRKAELRWSNAGVDNGRCTAGVTPCRATRVNAPRCAFCSATTTATSPRVWNASPPRSLRTPTSPSSRRSATAPAPRTR